MPSKIASTVTVRRSGAQSAAIGGARLQPARAKGGPTDLRGPARRRCADGPAHHADRGVKADAALAFTSDHPSGADQFGA